MKTSILLLLWHSKEFLRIRHSVKRETGGKEKGEVIRIFVQYDVYDRFTCYINGFIIKSKQKYAHYFEDAIPEKYCTP